MLLRIVFVLSFTARLLPGQTFVYEEEPHGYWSRPSSDVCAAFDAALVSGEKKLDFGAPLQVIRQVLAELKVPEASQVLVFSKTSLQKDRITPSTPRAVYFNEDCYVAWVPGGNIEFAAIDPQLGPLFYLLSPDRRDRSVPRLDRSDECMNCHGGSMTGNVPGVFIRSVFPASDGSPLLQAGTSLIDHTSPLEKRWGGWYVTGGHGSARHMGNVTASVHPSDGSITLDREKGANLRSLESFLYTSQYPRGDSDIVALMTLEHQVAMQSRLVEAAYDLRAAIVRQAALRRELGESPTADFVGSTMVVARSHVSKILHCLLFCEEAKLPEGGVDGGPGFQDAFRAARRDNADGQSLRDFQLLTRLFKYRCSYLIYSRLWDGLPNELRAMLYEQLQSILTADVPVAGYEHLGASERKAIFKILAATKDDLPSKWKAEIAAATSFFDIMTVDAATGFPIPLVEVETVNHVKMVSDNGGRIAFLEPDLMGQDVHFTVRSHGYEIEPDGFGIHGVRLHPVSGGKAEIRLRRINLATRCVRLTGAGRWRDSVLLGLPVPSGEPRGKVLGQDSVQATIWRKQVWWFWGDTQRASYPLGNFRMSGAVTPLPEAWIANAVHGIPYQYFTAPDGFSRPMVDLAEKEGVVWLDGIAVVSDEDGLEQLVGHYSRRRDLATQIEHGLVICDPVRAVFTLLKKLPTEGTWRHPMGHGLSIKEKGIDWLFYGDPFPLRRIPATMAALTDPASWEAWDGARWQKEKPPATPPVVREVKTDREITIHRGTINWNEHRKCWIMIANESGGKPSNLGEVWYAESPNPTGPWSHAVRIVTHDHMDFYNPIHHRFMDQEDGRIIYFEGTYTNTFSGNPAFTPRYEYNQILYRLDLDHEGLKSIR